ncbi:MAG: succinyldiaminopimelate transaminase [Steroidobacteraceae bacterium]
MNPRLSLLQPYPFERLRALLAGATPPQDLSPISLTIGEPRHDPPSFVLDALRASLDGLARYPTTSGSIGLRRSAAAWLERRFGLSTGAVDPATMVLPVNGTREALFAIAQTIVGRKSKPMVVMPNPFYQIYEGAALLSGAEPYYLATTAANRFHPDFDSVPASIWNRCELLYLCNPGNPSGAVLSADHLRAALTLADRYDFVVAADECYCELYNDDALVPTSLLAAAANCGNDRLERCIAFHSLSKRSNLPGLRSGFVAGDAAIIERFLLYRTYHGSAMSETVQAASIAAWRDDLHVAANRRIYREKFRRVVPILASVMSVHEPAGTFYLWPDVGMDDQRFVRELFARCNVTVVPGSLLAREVDGSNPGLGRVRISLVAPVDECVQAAERIRNFLSGMKSGD